MGADTTKLCLCLISEEGERKGDWLDLQYKRPSFCTWPGAVPKARGNMRLDAAQLGLGLRIEEGERRGD
jgi:hypothetical protein